MQQFTLTNEFGTIKIGTTPPYVLQPSDDGMSGLTSRTQEQTGPFQDGSTRLSNNDNKRFLTLTFMLIDCVKSTFEEKKRFLQKMFNPKIETTLDYLDESFSGRLLVYPETRPLRTSNKTHDSQQYILRMVAHQPYIEGDENELLMQLSVPGFILPTTFPTVLSTTGTATGVATNDGDVETPITVEFVGPAEEPAIYNNTTGEFIKINTTIARGETLIITTGYGNKRVILDDGRSQINKFGFIEDGSTFFSLELEDNNISYNAADIQSVGSVKVKWRNRYSGF